MKFFLAILFLLSACAASAQDKVFGAYYNYFGSELKLNPDATFQYKWQLELSSSWTHGTFKVSNDTIYLKMVPVYDTLWLGENRIKLYLSLNEKGERITVPEKVTRPGIIEGQNQHPAPEKLFLLGTRLYGVEPDGSLQKTKVKGYRTERKFDPWYMRVEGK